MLKSKQILISFVHDINLSLKELELTAKNRGIKSYKIMSKDKLLRKLDKSEQVKKPKATRDIRKKLIMIKRLKV